MIGVDRFGEEVQRAFTHGGDRVLDAAERRHDDDGHLGIELLGGTEDAEAVAIGEPEIGKHDTRPRALQGGHGFRLVARLDDRVPLRLECEAQHRPQRVLVLNQQNWRSSRSRAWAHRSQPAGTPALRASSSRSEMALLPSAPLFFRRSSSLAAFWRSRSMPARWTGSSRL